MMKMCQCGKEFYCEPWKLQRKKYCSKKCKHRYQTRPSGLTYKIKAVNRGWFKPGENRYERLKGTENYPWLVPPKGVRRSPKTEFRKGQVSHNFKADSEVGYHALHTWVRRNFGEPLLCEVCGGQRKVQWASKNWKYTRSRDDWWALCYWCHRKHDKNAWGVATFLFPEISKCGV